MARSVSCLVHPHPDHRLLDVAGPLDAFRIAGTIDGRTLYRTRLLSRRGRIVVGNAGVAVATAPVDDEPCDILLVAGGVMERMRDPEEVAAVRWLAANAFPIAGVCTGACLLAGAGPLEHRRATTHRSRAREPARSYPAVTVEADRILVADGPVWTSAGITAGIELARAVARELVVYHRRPSGQSQFSALSLLEPEPDRMRLALAFAGEHLAEKLPLERLADAARLSPRRFGRAFQRETGEIPAQAVARLRVEAARSRLLDGTEPVELIARAVGFGGPERMRRAFVERLGQPPQQIRRAGQSSRSLRPETVAGEPAG